MSCGRELLVILIEDPSDSFSCAPPTPEESTTLTEREIPQMHLESAQSPAWCEVHAKTHRYTGSQNYLRRALCREAFSLYPLP
ncbi:hypothetical protein E2C01_033381 [Portunus trituberculatus]|uniref:Uncharacterized protein n=1 Tax=Portunus trituberculatus TaxID=210409 RepID=A0A5B7F001_PORTR|nr:hypothetical protein [Portunus trituberculatus]